MANKRNVRLSQGAVKFSGIQAERTKNAPYLAQICAIKFYADFGKIMKFCVGFRHGDFGEIVKFRVEFRWRFDVAAKSCIEFRQG